MKKGVGKGKGKQGDAKAAKVDKDRPAEKGGRARKASGKKQSLYDRLREALKTDF